MFWQLAVIRNHTFVYGLKVRHMYILILGDGDPLIHVEFTVYIDTVGDRGGTVVKVLCYKSEGGWFDSRWCHWNFSLT